MGNLHSTPNFIKEIKSYDSCLAHGRYGIVLKASDASRNKSAIKFLFPIEDDEQPRLLLQHGRAAELVKHENIVQTLNFGRKVYTRRKFKMLLQKIRDSSYISFERIEERLKTKKNVETFCIQMELCGENLSQWLNLVRESAPTPPIYFKQMEICKNLIAGLKYLHDKNIVHGDLKPENVMFTAEYFKLPVKLGDFGHSQKPYSEELQNSREEKFNGSNADRVSLGLVMWQVVHLIQPSDRDELLEKLQNPEEIPVVLDHPDMPGVKSLIEGLTKQAMNLNEALELTAAWPLTAQSGQELLRCLAKVKPGGIIYLSEGFYEGEFVLEKNGVTIQGQGFGTVLQGKKSYALYEKDSSCIKIVGDNCTLSALAVSSGNNEPTGVELIGSRNTLKNLNVSENFHSIKVQGDHNILENLSISDTHHGIWIAGSFNKIQGLNMENVGSEGIRISRASSHNKATNITGINVVCGIQIHGGYNEFSKIVAIKAKLNEKFTAIDFLPGASNNTVDDVITVGYQRPRGDWVVNIDSSNSTVGNCRWIGGTLAVPVLSTGHELIRVYKNAENVRLVNCIGVELSSLDTERQNLITTGHATATRTFEANATTIKDMLARPLAILSLARGTGAAGYTLDFDDDYSGGGGGCDSD
ncbi:uncharacterized protein LOC118439420 [Folsomia candida]|uniref:Interferon-induced, double-stranded RNA-activated protein kinase n=1 Tax=Folsomia candida TaxID=158441 RepID=A0A226D3U0_FOLCA|nr:uncharacterized protein LOC118439420 [Folsomia candida]OXA39889.1 Interferon-induced, double-stranded RNA-activated protein kinase [Folsomia candida]